MFRQAGGRVMLTLGALYQLNWKSMCEVPAQCLECNWCSSLCPQPTLLTLSPLALFGLSIWLGRLFIKGVWGVLESDCLILKPSSTVFTAWASSLTYLCCILTYSFTMRITKVPYHMGLFWNSLFHITGLELCLSHLKCWINVSYC